MSINFVVVLNKNENLGFGFSLLGKEGYPHIIYDVVEDSPAAENEVEAGDVIVKIDGTDVHRLTTKEVLKRLRLSSEPVELELRRDPKIKSHVFKYLASGTTNSTPQRLNYQRTTTNLFQTSVEMQKRTTMSEPLARPSRIPTAIGTKNTTNSWSLPQSPQHKRTNGTQSPQLSAPKARFEAYMMTGDLILNISKAPRVKEKREPSFKRKNGAAPHAKYDSSPSPPTNSEDGSGDAGGMAEGSSRASSVKINVNNEQPLGSSSGSTTNSSSFSDGVDCPLLKPRSESKSINVSSAEISYSVPTSPTTNDQKTKEALSAPTSPDSTTQEFIRRNTNNLQPQGSIKKSSFRTSRSEDPLQQTQHTVIPIDIDDDFNSSLNTLLDTRDSDGSQSGDRIVWTYNAPVASKVISPQSSSSMSFSPGQRSELASPTSVSSSVMSSGGSTKNDQQTSNDIQNLTYPLTNDQSNSEALSNISSPDYQDEHDLLLSSRDIAGAMTISDPSDSDSTILASEKRFSDIMDSSNKIVIQISEQNASNAKIPQQASIESVGGPETEEILPQKESPPVSDDSDVDSLHSFHYSPKGVDIPSAVRLAKRLYYLEGFRKSDVSKHLSKNNEFSRAVAEEYLKYFQFDSNKLDEALRKFLKQFALSGETQERERVLVHFSRRYLDCNPNSFNSQDAVHTLTCAIMLLNTDLHGQSIGRKMSCSEFIENLSELNDGENFPKDVLKHLYQSIKSHPLEWAMDDDSPDKPETKENRAQPTLGSAGGGFSNPFLEVPDNAAAIEYKKGYVMRKCCFDVNNKKTPYGKRSWKMFYCTLRDLVLYLHKDEHGFKRSQVSDNYHNAIRIHHSLATKATNYVKKQHVFRLQTAEQAEFLFQTSDSKELQSWIDTINFVCGAFSAPALPGAVGSSKRFQRPLLPCSHTKLSVKEQLRSHDAQVQLLEHSLEEHKRSSVPTKGLALSNYKEKEAYLNYEISRYKAYITAMRQKLVECETHYESDMSSSTSSSTSPNPHSISGQQHGDSFNEIFAQNLIAGGTSRHRKHSGGSAGGSGGGKLSTILADG